MSDEKTRFRKRCVVRWVLLFAGVGWGISIWFVLVPWEEAMGGLQEMGAREIPYDPFLNYWMRVIGLAFGAIGLGCFRVAYRLERFEVMVPMVGWFHLLVGVGSLVIATSMGMAGEAYPTLWAEIVFSILVGVVLLVYGGGGKDLSKVI